MVMFSYMDRGVYFLIIHDVRPMPVRTVTLPHPSSSSWSPAALRHVHAVTGCLRCALRIAGIQNLRTFQVALSCLLFPCFHDNVYNPSLSPPPPYIMQASNATLHAAAAPFLQHQPSLPQAAAAVCPLCLGILQEEGELGQTTVHQIEEALRRKGYDVLPSHNKETANNGTKGLVLEGDEQDGSGKKEEEQVEGGRKSKPVTFGLGISLPACQAIRERACWYGSDETLQFSSISLSLKDPGLFFTWSIRNLITTTGNGFSPSSPRQERSAATASSLF